MVYESDFYSIRRPRPTITSYSVTSPRLGVSRWNVKPSVRASVLFGELDRIYHRPRPHLGYMALEDFLNSKPLIEFDDETKDIRAATDSIRRRIYTSIPHPRLSAPMRPILPHPMKESLDGLVEVKDCEPETMVLQLSYMYSGVLSETSESGILRELVHLTQKYQVTGLSELCELSLVSKIKNEEAVDTSKYYAPSYDRHRHPMVDDILYMSHYSEPSRTIGRGHLACVTFAGGRGYPRRRNHYYSDENRDIGGEIKTRSYYHNSSNRAYVDAMSLPTGYASYLLRLKPPESETLTNLDRAHIKSHAEERKRKYKRNKTDGDLADPVLIPNLANTFTETDPLKSYKKQLSLTEEIEKNLVDDSLKQSPVGEQRDQESVPVTENGFVDSSKAIVPEHEEIKPEKKSRKKGSISRTSSLQDTEKPKFSRTSSVKEPEKQVENVDTEDEVPAKISRASSIQETPVPEKEKTPQKVEDLPSVQEAEHPQQGEEVQEQEKPLSTGDTEDQSNEMELPYSQIPDKEPTPELKYEDKVTEVKEENEPQYEEIKTENLEEESRELNADEAKDTEETEVHPTEATSTLTEAEANLEEEVAAEEAKTEVTIQYNGDASKTQDAEENPTEGGSKTKIQDEKEIEEVQETAKEDQEDEVMKESEEVQSYNQMEVEVGQEDNTGKTETFEYTTERTIKTETVVTSTQEITVTGNIVEISSSNENVFEKETESQPLVEEPASPDTELISSKINTNNIYEVLSDVAEEN